jgi:hypothetical protein
MMNALSFIAELVKALAWPVLVGVLAFALRKPLSELIPNLTRVKYKDLELEFRQNMAATKAELQEALPSVTKAFTPRTTATDPLVTLAEHSPPDAIMKAWEEVEIAALRAAARRGLFSPGARTDTTRVIRALEKAEMIDPRQADVLQDLRGLRNLAAHSSDFALSTDDALNYIQLTRRMIDYLDSAHRPNTQS